MKIRTGTNSFSWLETIVYILILTVAVLGFFYADVRDTSRDSMLFLDAVKAGQALKYYSYCNMVCPGNVPAYDIWYYLIMGIWLLPIWLLNHILDCPVPMYIQICWCKILFLLLSGLAVVLTEKLIRFFVPEEEAAEYRLWLLLSPLPLFITVMRGHYDIIYLVIMLYALLILLKNRNLPMAALMFGAACGFKTFPFFAAVPVFLLLEKRKLRLFYCFSIGMIPVALSKLISFLDRLPPGAAEGKTTFLKSMFGRLFAPEFMVGTGKAALFITLFIIICFWAYSRNIHDEKREKEEILYFAFLSFCALFFCLLWHSNWLLLLTPFFPLAAAWNRRFKAEIFYSSMLLAGSILLLTSRMELWFYFSPLLSFFPPMQALPEEAKFTFRNLFDHYELCPMLVHSVFAGSLILLAAFSWPGWKKEQPDKNKQPLRLEMWGGFAMVVGLAVIHFFLYWISLQAEKKVLEPRSEADTNYRLSWGKEDNHFTNRHIGRGFHLKQKDIAPPLCLVPRKSVEFRKNAVNGQNRYTLTIPSYTGIRADLAALHLRLTSPMSDEAVVKVLAGNQQEISPVSCSRLEDGQHIIMKIPAKSVPAEFIILPSASGQAVELAEYYLEF